MNQQFAEETVRSSAAVAAIMVSVLIGVAIGLAINAVVCYLISTCFKRLPAQYRVMEPPMVWLLMIPCFNLIWIFFVFLRLADSYQAYFQSVGDTEVGDCGKNLFLAYCIVTCCAILPIPCVQPLVGLASLVLLILSLIKATNLKNRIPENASV